MVTSEMIEADLRICFFSVNGRRSGALTLMETRS
jgi:hypothetical protein